MALIMILKKQENIIQMVINEYCISNTILDADVIINIPKLKTHKKAGITVCLKKFSWY